MSRLSDSVRDDQELFESAAIIYARRLLALVLTAADQSGYHGSSALAVGATQLRGRGSFALRQHAFDSDLPRYNEDTYRRAVVVSHVELLITPGQGHRGSSLKRHAVRKTVETTSMASSGGTVARRTAAGRRRVRCSARNRSRASGPLI